MPDDIELNSGSGGATVAADLISGTHFPRSKIVIGADGTNDGDVSSANPLPALVTGAAAENAAVSGNPILVGGRYDSSARTLGDGDVGALALDADGALHISDGGNTITIDGTVTANLSATDNAVLDSIDAATTAIQTAVEIIDNAISGSEMQVDIVSSATITVDLGANNDITIEGGAVLGTSGSSGPANAVSIGGTESDGTFREMLVDSSGHAQVDVLTSALPSGAATETKQDTIIGHVDGVESSLGDAVTALQIMDDWDETNRAKVNLIVGQAGISAGAGAVAATTPRVTLASDDPGVALLTTIDTDTGNIAGSVSTIAGAVSGTEMQVDIVAALPTGTNAIGKLAANSGVDIGDVDVLSVAAGSNLIGDVGIQGRTTGGLSIYYDNDLDETAVAVKASAGTLYAIHAINLTAAPLYLQLFNVAQGSVTVGTTTPTVQFVIPANADSDGAGFTLSIPQGIAFSTAITAAASTGSETNGAPGNNECHVNLFYK